MPLAVALRVPQLCLGQDPQIGFRALAVHDFSVPSAAARRSHSILKTALSARKAAVLHWNGPFGPTR
jgi:hypothetical protein